MRALSTIILVTVTKLILPVLASPVEVEDWCCLKIFHAIRPVVRTFCARFTGKLILIKIFLSKLVDGVANQTSSARISPARWK
jgi:hypothetical protein